MNKYMVSFTCVVNQRQDGNGNRMVSAAKLTMDTIQAWQQLIMKNDPSLSNVIIMNVVKLDG